MRDLLKVARFIFWIAFVLAINVIYLFLYETERRGHNSVEWLRIYLLVTQVIPLGVISFLILTRSLLANSGIKNDLISLMLKYTTLFFLLSVASIILIYRLNLFRL